jgi:hypothetical protein
MKKRQALKTANRIVNNDQTVRVSYQTANECPLVCDTLDQRAAGSGRATSGHEWWASYWW